MSTFEQQKSENLVAYEQLRHEIPKRFAGQYVVIGQGKLLLSAPTYQDAWKKLKETAPDALHFLIFPAEKQPLQTPVKVLRRICVYLARR